MRCQQVAGETKGIAAIAAPPVVCRVIDHVGAHRVEFDVALAGKQVGFGLDEGGFVAAVPQCAGAAVDGVDVLHVTPTDGDDEVGHGFCVLWREQQVYVVGHEGVGMQGEVFFAQGFAQPVQVSVVVFFCEEAGLAIVSSLHDVQRNGIEMDALAAGHVGTLPQVKKKFEPGPFDSSFDSCYQRNIGDKL